MKRNAVAVILAMTLYVLLLPTQVLADLEPLEMCLYTEFEEEPGWWTASGKLVSDYFHSERLRIEPQTDYWLGYLNESSSVVGMFMDADGRLVAPLLTEEVELYDYQTANGNDDIFNYAPLYRFKSPANAYYFSYNLSAKAERTYRQFVSSKPIFRLGGTGNYVVQENDGQYAVNKCRRLCVIGPSTVMIDRLYREAVGQYISGFQEYLIPWFDTVDSYGFSGGSWKAEDTSYTSIYTGIVGRGRDLSGYDEYLLVSSSNSLTSDSIGVFDSLDIGTYFGGLNAVIDYILDQNPRAKIDLVNMVHKSSYFTDETVRNNYDLVNERLAELAENRGLALIDLAGGVGFTEDTYESYTYDGLHYNQQGSCIVGEYILKCLLSDD